MSDDVVLRFTVPDDVTKFQAAHVLARMLGQIPSEFLSSIDITINGQEWPDGMAQHIATGQQLNDEFAARRSPQPDQVQAQLDTELTDIDRMINIVRGGGRV